MGLEIIGRTHLYDRERSDLGCGHRSQGSVEDLSAGDGNRSRGHQSCADGCGDPAGDQEESLPQCDHPPGSVVSGFPTAC
jgi:hypothetical protein